MIKTPLSKFLYSEGKPTDNIVKVTHVSNNTSALKKCLSFGQSIFTKPSARAGYDTREFHHHHHHHHVVPLARISLTLSRHFSIIVSGRPSGLHPVSSHSCWMYVRAGRPSFARPYMGVHRSTSLMIRIQSFPSARLVASPSLKKPVSPVIYP